MYVLEWRYSLQDSGGPFQTIGNFESLRCLYHILTTAEDSNLEFVELRYLNSSHPSEYHWRKEK